MPEIKTEQKPQTTTKPIRKDAIVHYAGSDGEYIKVPEFDKLGNTHPGAGINKDKYEAGKTYYVSPDHAQELRRILDVYDEQTFRLLMSKVNKRALAQLKHIDFANIAD